MRDKYEDGKREEIIFLLKVIAGMVTGFSLAILLAIGLK